MARRKRYSRTNLIFFLLLGCGFLIYFLSKDTFSLFESDIEGSSDTDIAFYVLDDSLQTHELFIGDFVPGENKTIPFSVKNYKDGNVAEVDLSYTLTVKCTENMPIKIKLYEDSNQVTNYGFQKDSYGTWFYYINASTHQLIHAQQEEHNYILDIEFPAELNNPIYQDIIEAIEVTVDSKQAIE